MWSRTVRSVGDTGIFKKYIIKDNIAFSAKNDWKEKTHKKYKT